MKKLILALVLVITAAPALAAAYPHAHPAQNNRHAMSIPKRHRVAHDESSDPYWTPCDSSSDTSPNSCN